MAVWTLGLVVTMWRYLDEGKNRYLYIASALLALAFATKETSYIITVILGGFLALLIFVEIWDGIRRRLNLYGLPLPSAAGRVTKEIWLVFRMGTALPRSSRAGAFLVLLVTLTLPLWSAAVSVFENSPLLSWSNLVLAQETGSRIGSASGGGVVIAAVVVVIMLGLSVHWGSRWKWSVWWRCALIFYSIWVLLFTTFFTNLRRNRLRAVAIAGLLDSAARGGKGRPALVLLFRHYIHIRVSASGPGCHRFRVILRRAISCGNSCCSSRLARWPSSPPWRGASHPVLRPVARRDRGLFLSEVGERLRVFPGLLGRSHLRRVDRGQREDAVVLVNLALPLIVLAGKFLGDVIQSIQWRRLLSGGGWLLLPECRAFWSCCGSCVLWPGQG